ncbi:Hypothetical protein R9X50_00765600 [Acrodontium crateriforme]|uniref:EamA domain-containing protein n=1 Tax=Acrodontium crateriforme TaxID=150365 RepID=A0AAQ3R7X3_9PEZI|nr:Hypothetical protein R9X50_00765600 [Acrodontium crateriforme]
MSQQSHQWLFYAIASGGCAALNGVFAKLTTTTLTTSWAKTISSIFFISEPNNYIELLVRGFFLAMNLAFNAIMWTLFTRALTMATSTVQVSVINTSANFVLTAILGLLVFREELPPQWWLGASLLVAGSVVIGRREEVSETEGPKVVGNEESVVISEDVRSETTPKQLRQRTRKQGS